MKTHYDTLQIQNGASAQEIKRAYFSLVKQFPPERFPDQFKTLREAYDILSDAEKRAEYDKSQTVPEEVRSLLEKAGELNRLNKRPEAIQILRDAGEKHPEQAEIKSLLARSLEMEGKNGLAMKVWQELRILEPDNAEYARKLAISYDDRGWVKKAAKEYADAIRLDDGDADFWNMYIKFCYLNGQENEAKALCLRAERALRLKGAESATIYAVCVFVLTDSPEDAGTAERYLASMKRLIQSRPWSPEDEGDIVTAMNGITASGNYSLFPYIREMAEGLPKRGPRLERGLKKAELLYEAKSLEEKGFPDAIHDMCRILANEETDAEYKLDITVMEWHILHEITTYRPIVNRLKNEHPKLYALNSDFFDEALLTRNPDKLMAKREKILDKAGRIGNFGGSFQSETVRRDTPKIGRNDPCPCGSGKKYKRCCGAQAQA